MREGVQRTARPTHEPNSRLRHQLQPANRSVLETKLGPGSARLFFSNVESPGEGSGFELEALDILRAGRGVAKLVGGHQTMPPALEQALAGSLSSLRLALLFGMALFRDFSSRVIGPLLTWVDLTRCLRSPITLLKHRSSHPNQEVIVRQVVVRPGAEFRPSGPVIERSERSPPATVHGVEFLFSVLPHPLPGRPLAR